MVLAFAPLPARVLTSGSGVKSFFQLEAEPVASHLTSSISRALRPTADDIMGKRKKAAKKPQGKKKNEPLPTVFPCLFCNHEKSVTVKLDKKSGVGQLSCKVCSQQFQCAVNYLSAAVDVYADWVDACDAVAKGGGEEVAGGDFAPSRSPAAAGRPSARRATEDDIEDDDADIIDDEDGMGGYGGEGIVADDEY